MMNTRVEKLFACMLISFVPNWGWAASTPEVRVEFASAIRPLNEAAAAIFQNTDKTTMVALGEAGSSGALEHLCQNKIDIASTTRPISRKELDTCSRAGIGFIEVPIAFDALVIVVHPRNDFVKALSIQDLRRIWSISAQGKLKQWNQINPDWPAKPLTLLAPDMSSDDADYFNQAVIGKPFSRRDYVSSTDDEVLIQGVARSSYTLSYVSIASYLKNRNRLQIVPISSETGNAITPSTETISNGSYKLLARPLFMYVSIKALSRPEVKAYVDSMLSHAEQITRGQGYAALDSKSYQKSMDRVSKHVQGSPWEGAIPVGMTISELESK